MYAKANAKKQDKIQSKGGVLQKAKSPNRRNIKQQNPTDIIQRIRINPESMTQKDVVQLQHTIGNQAVQRLMSRLHNKNGYNAEDKPIQKKEEKKKEIQSISERNSPLGLPINLKEGLESLSNIDLSDVQVHYNSDKPQDVGALAFTQGNNIHIAPGQEKFLPHEGWHTVQQKQGRVQPTMQMKTGTLVNEDAGLEKEADAMGSRAERESSGNKTLQFKGYSKLNLSDYNENVIQKKDNASKIGKKVIYNQQTKNYKIINSKDGYEKDWSETPPKCMQIVYSKTLKYALCNNTGEIASYLTSGWYTDPLWAQGIKVSSYDVSLQDSLNKQMKLSAKPQTQKNGKWVNAETDQVKKYLDPSNFNDGVSKYQFLDLSASADISEKEMTKFLSGKGVLSGHAKTYLDAAKKYNVSEVYLAAHSALETGNGTSELAKGVKVEGVKVYNMYGINATDKDPVGEGSKYAYKMKWTSIDKAIDGGAEWISKNYINSSSHSQNTLYKMRWNPASPGEHQYATDIAWAVNQTSSLKKMYDSFPSASLKFDIPVYK